MQKFLFDARLKVRGRKMQDGDEAAMVVFVMEESSVRKLIFSTAVKTSTYCLISPEVEA